MKKTLIVLSIIIVFIISSFSYATENAFFGVSENSNEPVAVVDAEAEEVEAALNDSENGTTPKEEVTQENKEQEQPKETTTQNNEEQSKEAESKTEEKNTTKEETLTAASQKIIENTTKKDKKIEEYMKKYNNKTYAYTAYYLDLIQLYSIPVCIIGITIGAFNFYIIGEKKLEKREKGFSFIKAFLCGLVVFQVLPLLFALLVAGK